MNWEWFLLSVVCATAVYLFNVSRKMEKKNMLEKYGELDFYQRMEIRRSWRIIITLAVGSFMFFILSFI